MSKSSKVVDTSLAERHSVIAWIRFNGIKNEKGEPISFVDHPYLFDVYLDDSQYLVVMKCAQCGLSTCEIIKNHHAARHRKMDIIYVLPTFEDVQTFVGGKVNRIIANNPCMRADTRDKDTIEQKAIGESMIYFRGTFTPKAAIMISADRLSIDEKDSCKQDVVRDYDSRLDAAGSLKQKHTFSHPSRFGSGVHDEWEVSDKKEWFITCANGHEHYLEWDAAEPTRMSVDIREKKFICKICQVTLTDDDRRGGRWKPTRPLMPDGTKPKYSGYHISQLMSPRKSAAEICEKWAQVENGTQTEEYFTNKVLGLPYRGSGDAVDEEDVLRNCTREEDPGKGRIVVGVDSGIKLRYAVGTRDGLMGYGEMDNWEPRPASDPRGEVRLDESIEYFLVSFPNSIMVVDQGGDIIGPRRLQQKYPGRVFLCMYRRDRKTQQLVKWGEKDESGVVIADRNRMIQLVVDEFRKGKIPLRGSRAEWHDYWLHWSHIYRAVEADDEGYEERRWLRKDRDDWCHATVYWRLAVQRFGASGSVVGAPSERKADSYYIAPDQTASYDPSSFFRQPERDADANEEWR